MTDAFSIRLRVLVAILLCMFLVGYVGEALVARITEREVAAASGEALRTAVEELQTLEHSDVEKLSAMLDALVDRQDLRDALRARDRDRLLAIAAPLFGGLRERDGITHWYFIEPDGTVLLRVHRPDLHGDRLSRATFQKAAATQDAAFGKELGKTAFALRAVHPVVEGGKVVGYLELAEEIGRFLRRMKEHTGDEYGILVKKEHLDEQAWGQMSAPRPNTWKDRPDVVLVESTSYGDGLIDYQGDVEAVPDRGEVLGEVRRAGKWYVRGVFPLRDVRNATVGALFVLHDLTPIHEAVAAGRLRGRVAVLVLVLATAALLYLVLHRLLFSRLRRLIRSVEEVSARLGAEGRSAGRDILTTSADEIAQLEALLVDRYAEAPPAQGAQRRSAGE